MGAISMSTESDFKATHVPARGRAAVPKLSTASPAPDRWRWPKRAYKIVLGAGALAGAIAAVATFDLPHDEEDAAEFKHVQVTTGVLKSEYQPLLVAPHAQSAGQHQLRVALITVPSAGESSGPVTAPSPSPSSSLSPSPSWPEPGLVDGSSAFPSATRPSQTFPTGAAGPVWVPASPDSNGHKRLSAQDANREQLAAVEPLRRAGETRVVKNNSSRARRPRPGAPPQTPPAPQQGEKEEEEDEVGVEVRADLVLSGLRGDTVRVYWSMSSRNRRERLSGAWSNQLLGYALLPTSDHDTASITYWIPLPRSAKGPFVITSSLTAGEDGPPLATADTEPFRWR
jgi:hypothetical protein